MSFRHWCCNIRIIDFRSSWVSPLSWPALLTNTPRAPPSETGKWIPSLKDWWSKYLDYLRDTISWWTKNSQTKQTDFLFRYVYKYQHFFQYFSFSLNYFMTLLQPLLMCFNLSFLLKKSMFNSSIGTGYCPFEENLKGNLYSFV